MESNTGSRPAGGPLVVELGGRRFGVEDLAHVNRMMTIGSVLPNAAHEINNALQVVSGLVEMLDARDDLPPQVHEKLGRVAAQTGRATALVRDLLAYTRREQAAVARTDMVRLVQSTLSMRHYHLSRDRVRVSTRVDGDGPAWCRVDAHYLQQALVNLVLNAEQALRGRPDPRLTIAVEVGRGEVAVLVEDNGGGLQSDAAARAGEPFFSTADTRTLGLGLAVTRALAEMFGGRLELEALGTEGTRACLRLPRADA